LNNIQIIQTITSLLNIQSYSDKLGVIFNKSSIAFPQIYGPMADYSGVNAVIKCLILFKNITTMLCIVLLLKTKTQNINANVYNINRNKRAKTRDALSKFVNSLSISDLDSVRTQLGLLSMISSQTDEISRAFAVILEKFLSETKFIINVSIIKIIRM